MAQSLKQQIATFHNGARTNGVSGLRIVLRTLEHWAEHNAPVHYLNLIGGVVAADAMAFKRIAAYVTGGVEGSNGSGLPKSPKDGDGLVLNPARMDELRQMADDGLSFRGFKVKQAKADYCLRKAAGLFVKLAMKNKFGAAAIKAAVDAALKEAGE